MEITSFRASELYKELDPLTQALIDSVEPDVATLFMILLNRIEQLKSQEKS